MFHKIQSIVTLRLQCPIFDPKGGITRLKRRYYSTQKAVLLDSKGGITRLKRRYLNVSLWITSTSSTKSLRKAVFKVIKVYEAVALMFCSRLKRRYYSTQKTVFKCIPVDDFQHPGQTLSVSCYKI